jgi:glycosyltransferase involved in cell wall biosynthesis
MTERNLDHLHIHFAGSVATVGMLTAEAWNFTYSLTVHGPEEFYDVQLSYLPRKIERAKFICCISDFARSQLMKYCDPAHWDKMEVVRLGVDLDVFAPPAHRLPSLPIKILCVGRLVPAKGQHILLQSFAYLISRNYPVHLTFVGDGPDRPGLERFVAENRLDANVTFLGALNHDQTREQLMQADIFALASFAEGVPVALMEAMAMGIPTVSTCIAGIPELIRNEVDGLLVAPSSVEALSAALERLFLHPDLRKQMSASARARVMEYSNLAPNLELLASVFERHLT